jgi:CheY-like chemotaxis protein
MRNPPLVLIVDDEDSFLEIASLRLREAGFQTETVLGSEDALAKAEILQPDSILSDIYMAPGPSGWDLALALRNNPKTRDIKIVFFTTLNEPLLEISETERQELFKTLGAVTVFSKIDDIDFLGERVKSVLS